MASLPSMSAPVLRPLRATHSSARALISPTRVLCRLALRASGCSGYRTAGPCREGLGRTCPGSCRRALGAQTPLAAWLCLKESGESGCEGLSPGRCSCCTQTHRQSPEWRWLTEGFPCARPFIPATQWVLTVQVLRGLRCTDWELGLLKDLTQPGALPGLPAPVWPPQSSGWESGTCFLCTRSSATLGAC